MHDEKGEFTIYPDEFVRAMFEGRIDWDWDKVCRDKEYESAYRHYLSGISFEEKKEFYSKMYKDPKVRPILRILECGNVIKQYVSDADY